MLNPDEIISEEAKVLSLKKLQDDLTISINTLKGEEQALTKLIASKTEYLNNQDKEEVRVLTSKLNEIKALIVEGETALNAVNNKNTVANRELSITLEKIKNASNEAIDIIASANMEAFKIKEEARKVNEGLSKESNVIKMVTEGLEKKANSLKNEVIPALEKKEIELNTSNNKIILDIENNTRTAESLKKDIKNSEATLSANKVKNDSLVNSINRAERLLAQESVLEASVSGLTETIATLTAQKANFEISKEDKLAFDKDKYAVKEKEKELDQRIAFIKGVYEDFQLPW